jgi:stearoyl-CoA desaturase (delta-9 desaturase)
MPTQAGSLCPAGTRRSQKSQQSAQNVLASLHLPHLPTRNEILSRAMAMFASTPSIDDIVDQAYCLILDAIGARLCPNACRSSK